MNEPLPPDWRAIADAMYDDQIGHYCGIGRLYALTQKPRKELTDAERENLMAAHGYSCTRFAHEFVQAIEAAVWAKQREPETVTFRAARHKADGRVSMLQVISDANLASCWEWLEPPQTFEVKV